MKAASVVRIPPEYLALIGIGVLAFAAGCLVSGVFLMTVCQPVPPGGLASSQVCAYPFQGVGVTFLLVSGWLTIVGFNAFVRYGAFRGWRSPDASDPNVISVMAAFGALLLYLVVVLFVL